MHSLFFGFKRAHHATLGLTRKPLAHMGLTAARFDMLHALRERRRSGVFQSTLRRVLGVSRTTVSRMLASLEQLGLVTRAISPFDRRQRVVTLTKQGRKRIVFAHKEMTRSGWAQLAVDSALGGHDSKYRWYDDADCERATAVLDDLLTRVRWTFGDRAKLVYPWRIDEDALDPLDLDLEDLDPSEIEVLLESGYLDSMDLGG